jgi:hypothetical protein
MRKDIQPGIPDLEPTGGFKRDTNCAPEQAIQDPTVRYNYNRFARMLVNYFFKTGHSALKTLSCAFAVRNDIVWPAGLVRMPFFWVLRFDFGRGEVLKDAEMPFPKASIKLDCVTRLICNYCGGLSRSAKVATKKRSKVLFSQSSGYSLRLGNPGFGKRCILMPLPYTV